MLFPQKGIGVVLMTNRLDRIDEAFALWIDINPLAMKIAGIEE